MSTTEGTKMTDNLTIEQRERVEEMKRQRAELTNPFDRIAFDNSANTQSGEDLMLHLIAMVESSR